MDDAKYSGICDGFGTNDGQRAGFHLWPVPWEERPTIQAIWMAECCAESG